MKHYIQFFSLFISIVLLSEMSYGTHLRAGQITAIRDKLYPNTPTYIFTLTLYRDACPTCAEQPKATIIVVPISNGQRLSPIARLNADLNLPQRVVGPETEELTYTFNYTFLSQGSYVIYFQEEFRNAEIVNMSNSVVTPFYVETVLNIIPNLGSNSTPQLRNPPVDNAEVGQKFTHNPAAFDPDGDS
ncbi:hypothetical protein QNI16_33205, partial [Cytophagaceae bacterium YF14B1]|nr:hypothetical protein [Xanthocytophaga flavus]